MCNLSDAIEARGLAKGMAEGYSKGWAESLAEVKIIIVTA